jgi:hypothetical protein
MARAKATKVETVLIRIKRYGSSGWATCGIGVRPPAKLVGDPRMKRLCPKLVPGQVIELPTDHPLTKQRKLIEIVDAPEADEFIRPWVFKSDADAVMANPSKSRLGPDQILNGLAMSSGAQEKQLQKLEERQAAQEQAGYYDEEDEEEPDFADSRHEGELETEEQVSARSRNRMLREEKDAAEPVDDEEEPAPDFDTAEEETPRRRTSVKGGRRAGRTSRGD